MTLSDLTVPAEGSSTSRGLAGRAVTTLARSFMRLPALDGGTGPDREQWDRLRSMLRDVGRADSAAILSLARWPHIATHVRCLLAAPDPGPARSLAANATFDLWMAGVLPHGIELGALPAGIVSAVHRVHVDLGDLQRVAFTPGSLILGSEEIGRDAIAGHPRSSPGHLPVDDDLVLALVDDNPLADREAHPDKSGSRLDLGGQPPEAWRDALRQALACIATHVPGLRDDIALHVRQVVPVGYDPRRHLSASYREALGAIYLSLHPQVPTMAEALVHETSHTKLHALLEHDPLLDNAFTTFHRSPVRPDPRPLHGVLLAAHAFMAVARLYEAMADADAPESRDPGVRRRLLQLVRGNHEAVEAVAEQGRPTAVGRALIEELQGLDAHFRSRFDTSGVEAVALE